MSTCAALDQDLGCSPESRNASRNDFFATVVNLQDSRQRGRPALPPPVHNRRHSAAANSSRHAGRDSRAPRQAPLAPRNAGVQKVHGRPRNEPPHDRNARHNSGPAVSHGRAPLPRNAPVPRHGVPPGPRRASYPHGPPDRGPPAARANLNAPPPQQRQVARSGGPPPQHRHNARGAAPTPLARGPPLMGAPARGPPSSRGPAPVRVQPSSRGPAAALTGPAYAAPPRSRGAGLSPNPVRVAPAGARRGGPPGPRQLPHAPPQASPSDAVGPRGRTGYPLAAPPQHSGAAFPPAPRGGGGPRVGPPRGSANNPRVNQRQQPGSYRSPLAPAAQMPTSRAGPTRDPTPQGGSRAPRGGPQHDRPRSQSRGRQPPQVSVYAQEPHAPQQYPRREVASMAGSAPMQYEPAQYPPEPRADPYCPPSVGRGAPQQSWHDGQQAMDYQQGLPTQQVRF